MVQSFKERIKNLFSDNSEEKKSLICDFVRGGLIFDEDGTVKVCAKLLQSAEKDFILISNFNGLWLDVNSIQNRISEIKSLFTDGAVPKTCADCCYLVENKPDKKKALDFLYLSHWKCCFLNCVYCRGEKTDDISQVNHYDIYPVVEQMIDSGLVDKNTEIVFACGDASLHPEFDKLMYFFINYEMKNVVIHTSAQRYCHSIAEALGKNIAKVVVSLDSGCPYIYERVKGINKFDIVIANLKRYLEYEDKSKKQITINYTLVERVNDNKKEILDWFMLSRSLGIKKLSLDITEKWYNNLCYSIPEYLKELILFSKEIAKLNNIEMEFSPAVNSLYKRIKQES